MLSFLSYLQSQTIYHSFWPNSNFLTLFADNNLLDISKKFAVMFDQIKLVYSVYREWMHLVQYFQSNLTKCKFLFMKIKYRGPIIKLCKWWRKLLLLSITCIITILANVLWFGPLGSSSDSDLYFLNKALYLWLLCSLYFRSAEYKAGDKSSFCSNAELQYLAK